MKVDSKRSGSVVTASGPSAFETFTMIGASDLSSRGSMAWVTADGAEHVDLVDREHVVRGRLRRWYLDARHPGVVHQHIQTACLLCQGGDGGLDGSVEGHETAADRLRRLLAPAGIAGTEVDGVAERGDAAGGLSAELLVSSGDQGRRHGPHPGMPPSSSIPP